MSVQFLVDFENVHETGLLGIEKLSSEDSVFIFHTSEKDRIYLSSLDDVQAWVRVIPVPPGKQSLDMHLGSFLGYLIGKEDAETQFAIVSCDTGFRNVAAFWNKAYKRNDKVYCVHGIRFSLRSINPEAYISIPADYPQRHFAVRDSTNPETHISTPEDYSKQHLAIREFIIRMFAIHGVSNCGSLSAMLVCELCSLLNSLPEYLQERKRLGKKPLQYLIEECNDIIMVRRHSGQDWAFLHTLQQGIIEAPALDDALKKSDQKEAVPDTAAPSDIPADDESIRQVPAEAAPVSNPPDPIEIEGLIYDEETGEFNIQYIMPVGS